MDKLNNIQQQIEFLLVSNSSFKDIVVGNNPNAALPEQAINILRQMNKDEVEALCINHTLNLSRRLLYMRAPVNGEIKDLDDRFI